MAGETSRHLRDVAAAPHYHVTWPSAQGFAADLISPPAGAPVYEPVQTVWIAQGEPLRCPLAHGDNIPADEEAVPGFLERVVQQQPYWSA